MFTKLYVHTFYVKMNLIIILYVNEYKERFSLQFENDSFNLYKSDSEIK